MRKSEKFLDIILDGEKVDEIKKTGEPLYVMDITISEIEDVNPLEKRYGDYVYQCACVELAPLSFGEFAGAISEGKCESCLINGTCTCKSN
jgi:hypothetical protein